VLSSSMHVGPRAIQYLWPEPPRRASSRRSPYLGHGDVLRASLLHWRGCATFSRQKHGCSALRAPRPGRGLRRAVRHKDQLLLSTREMMRGEVRALPAVGANTGSGRGSRVRRPLPMVAGAIPISDAARILLPVARMLRSMAAPTTKCGRGTCSAGGAHQRE